VTTDLVGLAEALAVVAGSEEGAVQLSVNILVSGAKAFGGAPRDDREHHVIDQARRAGVLAGDGTPNIGPAAELVRICDLMRHLTPAPQPRPLEPDLVFTAPAGIPVEPVTRLDLLVADVVRMATTTLHLGGPFWNAAGFALLDPVVEPALDRGVEVDLWLHTSTDDHIDVPLSWATKLARRGTVRQHWYQSDGVSLMHAKFVVADAKRGYLGTANLTSLGMSAHVEIGTELTAKQCGQLLEFLQLLQAHDRFGPTPQGH